MIGGAWADDSGAPGGAGRPACRALGPVLGRGGSVFLHPCRDHRAGRSRGRRADRAVVLANPARLSDRAADFHAAGSPAGRPGAAPLADLVGVDISPGHRRQRDVVPVASIHRGDQCRGAQFGRADLHSRRGVADLPRPGELSPDARHRGVAVRRVVSDLVGQRRQARRARAQPRRRAGPAGLFELGALRRAAAIGTRRARPARHDRRPARPREPVRPADISNRAFRVQADDLGLDERRLHF